MKLKLFLSLYAFLHLDLDNWYQLSMYTFHPLIPFPSTSHSPSTGTSIWSLRSTWGAIPVFNPSSLPPCLAVCLQPWPSFLFFLQASLSDLCNISPYSPPLRSLPWLTFLVLDPKLPISKSLLWYLQAFSCSSLFSFLAVCLVPVHPSPFPQPHALAPLYEQAYIFSFLPEPSQCAR